MLRSCCRAACRAASGQWRAWPEVVPAGGVQQPPPPWHSPRGVAERGVTTSAPRWGIEDFLDTARKPGEYPKAGAFGACRPPVTGLTPVPRLSASQDGVGKRRTCGGSRLTTCTSSGALRRLTHRQRVEPQSLTPRRPWSPPPARYVLLKERNMLATERAAARSARDRFLNPLRLGKVRRQQGRPQRE